MKRTLIRMGFVLGSLSAAAPALAQQVKSDLRRQLGAQRAGVSDLTRLDELATVGDEIALLGEWLADAEAQLNHDEYEKVRELLDRCVAQAELIRHKTAADKLLAQAAEREDLLKATRARIERTKRQLIESQQIKKTLEAEVK